MYIIFGKKIALIVFQNRVDSYNLNSNTEVYSKIEYSTIEVLLYYQAQYCVLLPQEIVQNIFCPLIHQFEFMGGHILNFKTLCRYDKFQVIIVIVLVMQNFLTIYKNK